MNHSFIKPKPKPLLFQDTKIWISFISLALVILLGFDHFINLQISITNEDIKLYSQKEDEIKRQVQFMKNSVEDTQFRVNFSQNIVSNNVVIKDSVENLFDLIPQKITLTKIQMTQKKLTIQGITPNKDIYNFLLAIPLKSIFEESTVGFYLTDNGWYKFTSINSFKADKK